MSADNLIDVPTELRRAKNAQDYLDRCAQEREAQYALEKAKRRSDELKLSLFGFLLFLAALAYAFSVAYCHAHNELRHQAAQQAAVQGRTLLAANSRPVAFLSPFRPAGASFQTKKASFLLASRMDVTEYGREYNGRRTASGTRYLDSSDTIASNRHAFRTRLRVTWHGRAVEGVVRDRLARRWSGRVDVSRHLWRQLTNGGRDGLLRRAKVEVLK